MRGSKGESHPAFSSDPVHGSWEDLLSLWQRRSERLVALGEIYRQLGGDTDPSDPPRSESDEAKITPRLEAAHEQIRSLEEEIKGIDDAIRALGTPAGKSRLCSKVEEAKEVAMKLARELLDLNRRLVLACRNEQAEMTRKIDESTKIKAALSSMKTDRRAQSPSRIIDYPA